MVIQPKTIPHTAGIYIFNRKKTPIYIGKAADLKKRLASYFRVRVSEKVRQMREEATALTWIETESEIEALIREAELIKRHLPKYNVLMRDDKSYFYVVITDEQFPKIFVMHKPRPPTVGGSTSDSRGYNKISPRRVIGPFTSGSALHAVLKMLRRAFPYCTCRKPHNRPCLNSQIGRCLGFCCMRLLSSHSAPRHYSLIRTNKRIVSADAERYRGNIRNIIAVLNGQRKRIAARLKHEMREAAKKQDFERAAILRDQVESIENIFAHRRLFEVGLQTLQTGGVWRVGNWRAIEREIQKILATTLRIRRVEGYDISNISGTAATGSMVVLQNGVPVKSAYRKFKIKTVRGANDIAMHREVMRRRLWHPEWPYPDLIVMDGGKPQLHAAVAAWKSRIQSPKSQRPIIAALAKREEELYLEARAAPIRLDSLSKGAMHFFQRVRDESHRFAKKYHHKLREMSYC